MISFVFPFVFLLLVAKAVLIFFLKQCLFFIYVKQDGIDIKINVIFESTCFKYTVQKRHHFGFKIKFLFLSSAFLKCLCMYLFKLNEPCKQR